jgi:REP-associated tyrosine transposase
VHKPRPTRLQGLSYRGAARYHVRTSTFGRHPAFSDQETVAAARGQLLHAAEQHRFAVLAYCFMPDHVHLLLEARDTQSSLCDMIRRWKQATGFRHSRQHGRTLWQSGYFERILRREETTQRVADYIMANPVRAGLAERVGDYPYAWTQDY